jgi:uncharacterized protein with GYD domain
MPKYLLQASYSSEGLKGLAKDKASGRKAAIQSAIKVVKGKLECIYYTFGADDVILIVDLPDNVSAAAMSLVAGASGAVNIKTTPLLTIDEVDQALALPSKYRAPGS